MRGVRTTGDVERKVAKPYGKNIRVAKHYNKQILQSKGNRYAKGRTEVFE